ncbi:hypothetical protein Ddc_00220 [Ditylenchus destructor]|nr:hypothetical protein Ddc_00220 [Ditylenchus destructor]
MIGETYQIISELDQIIKTLEEQLRQKTKNTIDRSHSSDITIHVCFDGCWRTVGEPANGLIEGKRFSGPASNNLSTLGSIFGENVLGLCVELNTKQEIEEKIFKEENKKGKRALDKHTPQIERELKVESLPQFCSKLLQMHLDEVNEHHPSKRIFKEYPIANGTITHIGSAVSNPDNFFGKFHTNHSQEEEKGADKAKTGSQEIKNGKENVKPGTQGPLLQGLYSAANYVSGFGFGRSASKRAEHEN